MFEETKIQKCNRIKKSVYTSSPMTYKFLFPNKAINQKLNRYCNNFYNLLRIIQRPNSSPIVMNGQRESFPVQLLRLSFVEFKSASFAFTNGQPWKYNFCRIPGRSLSPIRPWKAGENTRAMLPRFFIIQDLLDTCVAKGGRKSSREKEAFYAAYLANWWISELLSVRPTFSINYAGTMRVKHRGP